jgi:hypothetical protein
VADRKEPSQFVGEFLREVAVLIIVLYPLDAWFQHQFDWWAFAFIAILAFGFLWVGIILDR